MDPDAETVNDENTRLMHMNLFMNLPPATSFPITHNINIDRYRNNRKLVDFIRTREYDQVLEILNSRVASPATLIDKVTDTDERDLTVLHWACLDGTTSEIIPVVEKILQISPATTLLRDKKGDTPLHKIAYLPVLFSPRIKIETIRLIMNCWNHNFGSRRSDDDDDDDDDDITTPSVRRFPLRIRNDKGETPLHRIMTMNGKGSMDIIRFCLKDDPDALLIRDDDGITPTDRFFRRWKGVLRTWGARMMDDDNDDDSHRRRCHDIVPEVSAGDFYDTIRFILDHIAGRRYKRQRSSSSSSSSSLPSSASPIIHDALRLSLCPYVFFQFLVLAGSMADIAAFDDDGRLLIHLAVVTEETSQDDECRSCKEKLSGVGDEEARNLSWYRHGEFDYCRACFEYLYDGLDRHMFELGSAVLKVSSAIKFLCHVTPTFFGIPDNDGRLPLHLAIENKRLTDDIKNIFLQSPSALQTRDIATHLYPFMLAATSADNERKGVDSDGERLLEEFSLVFDLLIEDPTLVLGVKKK